MPFAQTQPKQQAMTMTLQPTEKRVALYARFSTDLQRQTSIVDQLLAARQRAAKEGWIVTIERADEGVSGSVPVALRRGGKALLADALAGRFDVLIVEGLDRLSRDMGEQDQVVKRLEYRGIRLIGTSDGYDTEAKGRKVMRVARGLVNELYLDDLRDKTHRGLAGQFARGLSAGGRSFGYRTEDAGGGGGRRVVIDETEAVHVRWIFERAAEGHSVRAIAHQLNERGIASPRGGTWAVSALFGSKEKGLGLMNNELYVGRVVWNRRQWVKDPETGSRRYIDRPKSEWQVREQPELRIIDAELWQRVHGRTRRGPVAGTGKGRGASPKTLFGGLLTCNCCGGPIIAINRERYGCGVHKDRGNTVCASGATWLREVVDRRMVAELRGELLEGAAIEELQSAVRTLLAVHLRDAHAGESDARKRLLALDSEIGRLVDAVASIGISAAITDRLRSAEAERGELAVRISAMPATAQQGLIVDDVTARYKRMVLQLQQVLDEEGDRDRTRHILSEMLGPMTLVRDAESGEDFAELDGPAERLLFATVGESLGLVARAGFEPATFGL
ncbi:recombinase family protein [soil metagenome]